MKIRSCDDRSNLSVISYIKKALNKNLCISEMIILPSKYPKNILTAYFGLIR